MNPRSVAHPAFRRPISQCIHYLTIASARCRLAVRISRGHRFRAGPLRFTLQLSFVADQWGNGRWFGLIYCSLQGLRFDPRGAGHVRRRMPRPADTPGCCIWLPQLRSRVGQLPSCPRRSRHQEGRGRNATRGRHGRNRHAVLGIQRRTIALQPAADPPGMHRLRAHRRQGAARGHEDSPCRAESRALVGKNASGAVQPADGAQYPESNATSCAAMLRDCRAHSSARIGVTSGGLPRPIAPLFFIFISIGRD